MGAAGFEHPPESSGNSRVSETGGSKSGNIRGGSAPGTPPEAPTDPELTAVVAVWSDLPPALRAGILAAAKAATPTTPPSGPAGGASGPTT